MQHRKVIIIGSGPAGFTAAIYASRANLSPLLLRGPTPGGWLTITTEVENFPGFPKGVMGPELMQLMEDQAARFGTTLEVDTIQSVDLHARPFVLTGERGQYSCDALIIGTGATPRTLGIPGEKELTGYGVSTCATCDGAFFRNQVVALAGGGDSACEEAAFLSRFASKVYLIHRRDQLRASKIMQERVFENPKIEILWNKEILEVQGSKKEGVKAIVLRDNKSDETSNLETAALFVAIGHVPNTNLFQGLLETDSHGYLVTIPGTSKTNIPGVFVCGDVQDPVYRQAITAAGTGCMAAIDAERYLEGLGK